MQGTFLAESYARDASWHCGRDLAAGEVNHRRTVKRLLVLFLRGGNNRWSNADRRFPMQLRLPESYLSVALVKRLRRQFQIEGRRIVS